MTDGAERAAPEPTTAEAFATVRGNLGRNPQGPEEEAEGREAERNLSLLERRMGAQEEVLSRLVESEAAIRASTFGGEGLVEAARAALAGATPVSQVPTELAVLIEGFADEVRRAEEHHANKGRGGMSVPFHGDFASVPPSSLGRLRWWANALKDGRTTEPVLTLEEAKRAILDASNAKRGEREDRYRVGISVALNALDALRK